MFASDRTITDEGYKMTETYNTLLVKLDAFIRKYYQNKIIRGAIYFVAIGVAAFILSAVLEYYGRFSSGVRAVLFFGLAGSFLYLFIRLILIPALKLLRLGSIISHEDASRIIGVHFPEVSDKLLNTLQLKRQAELSNRDSSLLLASIDQRIEGLQPIPFSSAINFGENRKYLKYAIPPVALAIILLMVAPAILRDGAQRIVTYSVDYVPAAPFAFNIENPNLEVPLNDDFNLVVQAEGSYYPAEMSVSLNGKLFRLKNIGSGKFSYTFRNVRNETPFKLTADGFFSEQHTLSVLPTPSIVTFDVELSFPAYLNKPSEQLSNTGNLRIPEGTRVNWKFSTQNTEKVYLNFGDSVLSVNPDAKSIFTYQRQIFENGAYDVAALNSIVGGKDTIRYRLDVIKDAYPRISVEESRDSTDERQVFFGGSISDDYGLKRLQFHYSVNKADGSNEDLNESIAISGQSVQEFYFYKNFQELALAAGDRVDYYFEVWDNDGVNGSKSSRSVKKTYKAPTLDELKDERNESSEKIKEQIEQSIKEAAELKKEMGELNKDILQKKEMSWQEKKRVEDLLKKQKELEKTVESLKKERKTSQQKQENFLQQSESILEKQRQLEKMFDELMSEEMKEMYRKLEELMEKMDQEQIREQLENMQMSNEELEKELDRTLEIFKQMEFEQEFEQTMQKLEELAKEQEELSENKEMTPEEKKAEQDKLNEEFEEVRKDIDELEKKNEALENPMEMPDTEKSEETISEDMEKASEDLDQKKEKKASESQKSAAQQMQQMQQQMQAAMESGQSESAQEDMDALRALLENIIQLSFDQEEIMEELKLLDRDDPKYVTMGQKQKKLKDDSQMVEDSLFALSKRVVQIERKVNEEIGLINQNIEKAIEEMGERVTASATSRQQYAMTSFNNLALLLDEALRQMQMQMASQMPGTGNCEKPGGSGQKPSSGNMSKMQEAMGKKLEEMQKALEKGKKPGQKPGEGRKPGEGGQGMSQEIAKMAAEQAAIRREIEKMAQQLNEQGKGEGKGLQEAAEQMEEIEKDLVNQEITRETLKRQQNIITRLLESEKAEREREYDNQRESNSPKPTDTSNPEEYLEYKRRKAREVELLRTVPPDLKPYYKDRVNDYFLNFEN